MRPGYSHLTQYISELGERGSSTEFIMRYAGFVPTGLMHVAFAAFLYVAFKGSRLAAFAAALLAINGLARVAAGMFPCETGCAGAGLISQRLHNLSATVGFFALIGAALIWGVLLRRYQHLRVLSLYSIGSGILGLVFLVLMSRSAGSRAGTGLYECLASGVLSLWILVFAAALWWRGTYRDIHRSSKPNHVCPLCGGPNACAVAGSGISRRRAGVATSRSIRLLLPGYPRRSATSHASASSVQRHLPAGINGVPIDGEDPVHGGRALQEQRRRAGLSAFSGARPDGSAGLVYVSSWVDQKLERCYQLMETEERTLLDQWIANWSDITDFEVVPVMTSKEAAEKIAPSL